MFWTFHPHGDKSITDVELAADLLLSVKLAADLLLSVKLAADHL